MPDAPDQTRDDPASTWEDDAMPSADDVPNTGDVPPGPAEPETVGTGSYVAVSCVLGMGMLLVVLILGLLISRWIG